jgi:beta-N-acetylhexosaminidase
MKNLVAIALAASLLVGCSRATSPSAPVGAAVLARVVVATAPHKVAEPGVAASGVAPSLSQLVGQKLVVRMDGLVPSADLLGRIRRGEVGGIILFGPNITTPTALISLTRTLSHAAFAGGQPNLLIGVDQEGGPIKRIPWIAPWLSAPQMGRNGQASVARTQGASTGSALRALGINVDLAPVADVPASTASFMYRAGRTFSFSSSVTAALADAFATGLESGGVDPAMKHFPGIGFATRNTDASVVTITASSTALNLGLRPYRTAIGHHIPLIMLSNATYPGWDPNNAAGWSRVIVQTLLRRDLRFAGVTITDSLDGTAAARGLTTRLLAVRAARAGTDMILTTGTEAQTRAVYATLLREAQLGWIPTATLRVSYARILTLKAGL